MRHSLYFRARAMTERGDNGIVTVYWTHAGNDRIGSIGERHHQEISFFCLRALALLFVWKWNGQRASNSPASNSMETSPLADKTQTERLPETSHPGRWSVKAGSRTLRFVWCLAFGAARQVIGVA